MRRSLLAISACVCLAAFAAAVLAQGQTAAPQRRPAPVETYDSAGSPRSNPYTKYRDPSEHVRERRIAELLAKWKETEDPADRRKLEESLRGTVKEEFEARLGFHEKEVEQLEARVKQLREQLERRRDKQDEIVDFRVQQLLREAQGLGWGTEPVIPRRGVRTNPFGAFPVEPATVVPRR
jgi:hypothetical protein